MKYLILPLLLASSLSHASLCESGRRQSPVNITAQSVSADKLPPMKLHYTDAPLRLANDGHTLRVRFDHAGDITLGNEHYRLEQFHFHTPAGDEINGKRYPFAAHILHRGAHGHLLAITVLFQIGAENAVLSQLLPLIPPRIDGDHKHPQVTVNAARLLPAQLGYYRYSGSLTASPCTENVEWLVMKQPLELSQAQLQAWQKHFADNMRDANPLNGRIVRESD